jgi:transposase
VSSGEQTRLWLSPSGNRRLNHALHMIAVTQLRFPKRVGRRYYERKRLEGKTPKEALRGLKRRLSDDVYRQLAVDQAATIEPCASPTTAAPMPSTSRSPTTPSHPAGTASQPAATGTEAFVVLDWKDNRLVGIEVLDARSKLHPDFLAQADVTG